MRRRGWSLVLVSALVSLPGIGWAQGPRSLGPVAESARDAIRRGDLEALLPGGARVRLQLPGVEPSTALGAAQAGAALRNFLRRGETRELRLVGYREVGRGRAYVELLREFQLPGGGEIQRQRILLGYRRGASEGTETWELIEVRVN